MRWNVQSNVVLHEATQPTESLAGLIRVRLNDKTDENISADMEADIRTYRARYPKIRGPGHRYKKSGVSGRSKSLLRPRTVLRVCNLYEPRAGETVYFFCVDEQSKVRTDR